jgi:hypothetical protein
MLWAAYFSSAGVCSRAYWADAAGAGALDANATLPPRNRKCDARHSGPARPLLTITSRLESRSVMITRAAYSVRERVYPLAVLFVGLMATFGGIGLLGYGLLALMGY